MKKATAKPTWSDEPLIVAVWEAATEFGSVFWIPWAILDSVVTYSLNWQKTENKLIIFAKEDVTNLNTVDSVIKDHCQIIPFFQTSLAPLDHSHNSQRCQQAFVDPYILSLTSCKPH